MTLDQALNFMWYGNSLDGTTTRRQMVDGTDSGDKLWRGCAYWGGWEKNSSGVYVYDSSKQYQEKYQKFYRQDPSCVYIKDDHQYDGSGETANCTMCWEDIRKAYQGNAWCCCYVYWVFVKTFGTTKAKQALYVDYMESDWNDFYCATWLNNFREQGAVISSDNVQSGDIFFYRNSSGRISHIGIVVSRDGDTVLTAEGNHGDKCCFNEYRTIASLDSFARPNWTGGTNPLVDEVEETVENKAPYIPQVIEEEDNSKSTWGCTALISQLQVLNRNIQKLNK